MKRKSINTHSFSEMSEIAPSQFREAMISRETDGWEIDGADTSRFEYLFFISKRAPIAFASTYLTCYRRTVLLLENRVLRCRHGWMLIPGCNKFSLAIPLFPPPSSLLPPLLTSASVALVTRSYLTPPHHVIYILLAPGRCARVCSSQFDLHFQHGRGSVAPGGDGYGDWSG